ncbi:MAG TPA: hypothetical protein VGL24_06945 [Chthoniobacterales bacterium]|jgi:hypothetical protein
MKTRSGWFHLRGLSLVSTGLALGTMLCASANAGPVTYRESNAGRPHMAQEMPAQKIIQVYILTSASAIPKPISYVIGGLVTTAVPIQIIGRGETISR